MKLSDYLALHKITSSAFADLIGVTQSSVSRFCNGTRRPDLTTIEKIHKVTGGQVTAEDFFETPVSDAPKETLPIPSTLVSPTLSASSGKSSNALKTSINEAAE